MHHIEGVDAPERIPRRPLSQTMGEVRSPEHTSRRTLAHRLPCSSRTHAFRRSFNHLLVTHYHARLLPHHAPQTHKKNVYNARTIDDYRQVSLTQAMWKGGKAPPSPTRSVFGVPMSKIRELSPRKTSPVRRGSAEGLEFPTPGLPGVCAPLTTTRCLHHAFP